MGRLYPRYFASSILQEVPGGTVDGSNTAFTLASVPATPAAVILTVDGVVMVQGSDYTLSAKAITMLTAPEVGQTIQAYYLRAT